MFEKIKYINENEIVIIFDTKKGKEYIAKYGRQAYFRKTENENGEYLFVDFVQEYINNGGEIEPVITSDEEIYIQSKLQAKKEIQELQNNTLSVIYNQIAILMQNSGLEATNEFNELKLKGVIK